MLIRTVVLSLILTPSLNFGLTWNTAIAAEGVNLYTPYTKISVPPGESVDYTIDVKNSSSEIKNVNISVSAMPKGWGYTLKSGGWNIRQLSILPGEMKSLSFKVDIPLKVNKGNYQLKVEAAGFDVLPLMVNVSEQGTFKTEFTSDQANMEGHAKSNFTFTTKLKNFTGEKQFYALRANPPRGWNVTFKPNYKQATAVEIEANGTSNISVEITPPYNVKAGTYKIPVRAATNSTLVDLDLEVVISGSYEMELTTPNGLLSSDITAGKEKRIELLLKNTGSVELENIRFTASKPQNWDVSFKPDTVQLLRSGENTRIYATIKAYEKAIPGDYATNISARTEEVDSNASFRIQVKTPMLWAWLGVFIIAATLGSVYYLFRKYGRR
ncbi:MAG: hypothetical protein JXJ22_09885 [Bacteroidales bacterium]|nr:hypothetical protein [Bacteroidales bacterium]